MQEMNMWQPDNTSTHMKRKWKKRKTGSHKSDVLNTNTFYRNSTKCQFVTLNISAYSLSIEIYLYCKLYQICIPSFYSCLHSYMYLYIFMGFDYRRGLDWWIGFIGHLYTPLGTTSNYSSIADLHTLPIITRFSPSLLCLQQPFPSNGI
jgi:hypothetical protein